jgi:hypothetical protein
LSIPTSNPGSAQGKVLVTAKQSLFLSVELGFGQDTFLDNQNPIISLQLVAFLVLLVGLIWSSYAGWSELELSNPDGNTLQEPTHEAAPVNRKPPTGNALEDRNWI